MHVETLLAPNPGVFTGRGTNTYVVASGGEAVCIDPGPEDDRHLAAILAAAARHGRLTAVLLTHSHPDHRPLARGLADRTGARLRAFDPGDDAAEPLADGEEVAAGDVTLRAVHTPGHAADHICFLEPQARLLFSGDHVLGGGSTTVVAPPDGDMRAYLDSLLRVRDLRPARILPGHGPPVEHPVAELERYHAHRLEREDQVLAALRARGAAVPDDLVPELYAAYPRELWPLAAMTVRAHLDKLAADGAAEALGDGRFATHRG